jgi:hypothetical protein
MVKKRQLTDSHVLFGSNSYPLVCSLGGRATFAQRYGETATQTYTHTVTQSKHTQRHTHTHIRADLDAITHTHTSLGAYQSR